MNCKLVLSNLSQFFHSLRLFSNQAKLRSTIQRLGMTLKVEFQKNEQNENGHPKIKIHHSSQPNYTSRKLGARVPQFLLLI